MSMQNMKRSETTEQIALFNWAKRTESILPERISRALYRIKVWQEQGNESPGRVYGNA